jgi:hypothetical protein
MPSSKPNSDEVTVSGFKPEFNLTVGDNKVVSPRYPCPGTLKV